jgi:hypothetical protein
MGIFNKMLKSFLPKLGVLLVLISFGFMTGLAPVLHAHELDLTEAHDDCAPCHWSQSNKTDETTATTFSAALRLEIFILFQTESIDQQIQSIVLNRGPPQFS